MRSAPKILVVLSLCFFSMVLTKQSSAQQPEFSATIMIPGINSDVRVERDEWGVPSIIASNDHDLFFGLGYVMAQDRLWQMDGSRRLAEGRVAEIGGQKQLHWDIYHRGLKLAETARASVDLLAPETRDLLQAFADGVNTYVETTENPLPMEFLMMDYEPEPWEIQDSLVIARLVAAWLSADETDEDMYGRLIDAMGPDLASDLFPPVPKTEPLKEFPGISDNAGSSIETNTPSRHAVARNTAGIQQPDIHPIRNSLVSKWLEPLAEISSGRYLEASNTWAVDGGMTESGETILAMDPHLNYFTPSVLYEFRLKGGSFDCWGATFPGMPVLPFGANRDLAWGASNFPADTQDLFIEKLNPADSNQYKVDGEWVDFDVTTETIRYLAASGDIRDYVVNVYTSVHGPVIEQRFGEYVALKWTGLNPTDDVTPFLKAMRCSNLDDFYELFRHYHSPTQNLCVAEAGRGGRVGQIIIGDIPIRSGYDGRSPVDGSDSSLTWSGFIPYDEKPHNLDPDEGYVVHANNLPSGGLEIDGYPGRIMGSSFSSNHRINRITELLHDYAPLDPEDMRMIQMDDLDSSARIFVPALLGAWDRAGEEWEWIGEYVEMLRGWDYHLSADSVEATLYQIWLIELADNTLNRRIPYLSYSYLNFEDRWIQVLEDYAQGESELSWFQDETVETIDLAMLAAFSDAVDRLKNELGDNVDDWKWGDLNRVVFPHPSGVEMMGAGSHRWGGGRYTIRVAHYSVTADLPFQNDFGAVFRSVVASVNGEWQIQAVLPPGECAYCFGPNGNDQMEMWLNGDMRDSGLVGQVDPSRTIQLIPRVSF